MTTTKFLAIIAILLITLLPIAAITYLIVGAVKHLIWYNADCQFRYAQYSQAQKELDRLEEDIEQHKNYDWTKEPKEQTTKSTNARPGSDAHYEAWRAEQRKKAGKE